jgi:hypothetical protein
MRTIILLLLLVPVFATAQKQDVFLRLTDANGKQISGDAIVRGYEKWIPVLTTSSGGKNNTQLSFTMNITGASADLKKAMSNGELLVSGQLTVLQPATSSAPRPASIHHKNGKDKSTGLLRSDGV